MMDLNFELFDLISLSTILVGIATTYWKLSNRLSITEVKVDQLEQDLIKQESYWSAEINRMESKLDRRLATIEKDIKSLLIAIGKLNGKE